MTNPTAREVLDEINDTEEGCCCHAVELAARVEKVLALHEEERTWEGGHKDIFICTHCRKNWPCPTLRLLNGEDK